VKDIVQRMLFAGCEGWSAIIFICHPWRQRYWHSSTVHCSCQPRRWHSLHV